MSSNIVSGSTYKITNVQGQVVCDVSGVDNKSIIAYAYHNGNNQKWVFTAVTGGWTIKSVQFGTYLGIAENAANGVHAVVTSTQLVWNIWRDKTNPNTFRLFIPNTTYTLDLANHGDSTPGNPVQVWESWEGPNQVWQIEAA